MAISQSCSSAAGVDCVWKASRPWEPADHGCTRLQAAQAADVSPHELAGALASLSQLRELHLSSLQLGDARMQEIAEMFSLGTFPHLQRLYLAHNSLGAAGATALAKALRVLNLPENAIRSAGTEALAGALISGATPLLEQLVLAGNGIGTIGARAIATALKQLPRLQDLHLARNALGSQGAVAISRALKLDHAPALEWLSLTENAIGDMGLQALSASVARMPRLEWLDLELNGITDIGASALGQALSQTAGLGLRELDMRGNKAGGFIMLESMAAYVRHSELSDDLQSVRGIRSGSQVVALTCANLAAKYWQQRGIPEQQLHWLSCNAFTRQDFVDAEVDVLRVLDYNVHWDGALFAEWVPLLLFFCEDLLLEASDMANIMAVASHVIDILAFQDELMSAYWPSELAAGTIQATIFLCTKSFKGYTFCRRVNHLCRAQDCEISALSEKILQAAVGKKGTELIIDGSGSCDPEPLSALPPGESDSEKL
ncbi:Nlrc3 [Symbiodinium sp. KB8]|nr:Nlrc3 [Symbiodinium sp. KB8]